MTITKQDLVEAYGQGRDRGQAEGLASRRLLEQQIQELNIRNLELEAQADDLLRDFRNARQAVALVKSGLEQVYKVMPPVGGLADGVKSEPASEHGPDRAAAVSPEEVPWADLKS